MQPKRTKEKCRKNKTQLYIDRMYKYKITIKQNKIQMRRYNTIVRNNLMRLFKNFALLYYL